MIRINQRELEKKRFPDGTYLLHIEPCEEARVEWRYESDEELFQLYSAVRHLREKGAKTLVLTLPFLPNARMDRVKEDCEVFTLKYFCEFINHLSFDRVEVWDVHSEVGAALLNKVKVLSPGKALEQVLSKIGGDNLVLYFPDEGAKKRYKDLLPGLPSCYGKKMRDWKSGEILGLQIEADGVRLEGSTVLMVDDICSYGGTLYYSALALRDQGVKEIYSFTTHTENSLLSEKSKYYKLLQSSDVQRHFTTPGLMRDPSAYIEEVSMEDDFPLK